MSDLVIGIKQCVDCHRKIRQAETPPEAYLNQRCNPCQRHQDAGTSPLASDATKSQSIAIKPSQFLDIYRRKEHQEPITTD